jgi:hypothetical protein
MRRLGDRQFGRGALFALLLVTAALLGCDNESHRADISAQVLPGLADRRPGLTSMVVRGAGAIPLVSLEKSGGVWRVRERDWPADAGRVDRYLFELSQAHRTEAKTADPKLYVKLGLEPVALESAQGVELRFQGGGAPLRLSIGRDHATLKGSYVRIDEQPRAWLADRSLAFDRDPRAWLDRSLIDLPLARIAEVRVEPLPGRSFTLIHRQDRFVPEDASATAIAESERGNELAGVLDHFEFEDVAADDGLGETERRLRFTTVDGAVIDAQAGRIEGRIWVRLSASIDDARARSWSAQRAAQSRSDSTNSPALPERVVGWNARFSGRRFLLPDAQAAILMLGRAQILGELQ